MNTASSRVMPGGDIWSTARDLNLGFVLASGYVLGALDVRFASASCGVRLSLGLCPERI